MISNSHIEPVPFFGKHDKKTFFVPLCPYNKNFKQMKLLNIQILLITLLLINSCSENRENEVNIKIIETTDIHGSIFPFDFIKNKETNYSQAQVYSFVKKERENKQQEVILLDNGDILQGQPVVYYSNFEDVSSEHICASVMNYMNYDAATIGNHDIEGGHTVYDRLVKEFKFSWLSANAINKKTGKPYFKPYKIIKRKGVKIAVLGLITPAIPKWLPEKIWEGMQFEDMIVSAKKWMKIIKEKENPDIIVGLFHAGVDYTYNNETDTTFKNENASVIVAKQVPGFDIIFTGHDHKEHNFIVKNIDSNDVLILDPRSHAQFVAVADINLKWNNKSKTYDKTIKGSIVSTNSYKPDSSFMVKFDAYITKVKKYVNRKIAYINSYTSIENSYFGDSEFIDLIHKIQLEQSKADISFAAPLNFNTKINKGDFFVSDMFKLYKFENLLYTIELSGKEINDYLEFSYNLWIKTMKNRDDDFLNLKKTDKGDFKLANAYYNFSSAEGVNYTVDVSKQKGERVNISNFTNGDKFYFNKKYKVAINSYRGNGGGNHLTAGAGIPKENLKKRILQSTQKDLRYYMLKWIEKQDTIYPSKNNNWKFIPEKLTKKAKKRDFKILFGN